MVCVTNVPVEFIPTFKFPAEAVEQEYPETAAVPLELAFPITVLLKEQLGVVFNVKALVVPYIGVPLAVNTIFCKPVPAKVPAPAKVTPLALVEILYVPAVVTLAVMVCDTPDTAVSADIVPVEAVEQV